MSTNPLGQTTEYVSQYDPGLLFAIARDAARQTLDLGRQLPFSGVDIWNAWDLTWLDANGKPMVATAEITVAADSPNLIESKSLKLYLNSHAMTRYADTDDILETVRADLSKIAGSPVAVSFLLARDWHQQELAALPGTCIDEHSADCRGSAVNPALLRNGKSTVELCNLHSHLLRSLCPVTNQPDSGSILIRYSGLSIDAAGLLKYLVSYRQHNDFHEACVERIFIDIMRQCEPEQLTVYARFSRRGGLDINPFRSSFEAPLKNLRLWRQ